MRERKPEHLFIGVLFCFEANYCIFMAGGRKSVKTVSNEVRDLNDEWLVCFVETINR